MEKSKSTSDFYASEESIMFVEGVSLEAEREAPRNLMKTYYNWGELLNFHITPLGQ